MESNGYNTTQQYNNQHSAAHNNNSSAKDPLDYFYSKDSKSSNGSFKNFCFHEQIQDCEMELQYLHSNKSDFGGTTVGVSDSKMRFLGIKSYGIINNSIISIILNFIVFSFLFLEVSQLLAIICSILMLIHVLFPGYIAYGMKRFTNEKGKFTYRYYKKILNIWHTFEFIYLSILLTFIYLCTINVYQIITDYMVSIQHRTILHKVFNIFLSRIDLTQINTLIEVFTLSLLIGLFGYLVMIIRRTKYSEKIRKEIEFEHLKETRRPAELARIKAGKKEI
ncbi:hypothetical protein CP985_03485 [Malaciobacter mytili LMG 24559]|uniref:Uncharacterized protein n=1 Tax=Malaciobacter mytili LMG 24559 TaxID=1032238 RepID=A0AAX2AHL1_9BACT|nr:hypothetical protein [Malaciobacter mytili]AXH16421.1 putative membrane protein [Malaciobacter mytili LMG 24559]RXK16487.1 hypothetical protein CP985_03485 [Malaciobacter mytili LMG 24559]